MQKSVGLFNTSSQPAKALDSNHPPELVVGLVDKIEIGEKHPDTDKQNVSIIWKF